MTTLSIATPEIWERPLAGNTTPGLREYQTYSAEDERNSACRFKVSPVVQELKSPGSVMEVFTWVFSALPRKSYGPAKSLREEVKEEEVLDLVITALKGESQAAPLPNKALGSKPNCVKFMPTSAR
jgi:hypothetical protein